MGKLLIRAALVLGIAVLAVEGYYVYHYYRDLPAISDRAGAAVSGAARPATTGGATRLENTTATGEQVFVHHATSANTSNNSTYLDNPLTDGRPDAVLTVTQNWNPGGGRGIYNDHPVGVWYDSGRKKWAIFNQDRAKMPEGAAFNVLVAGGPASR